MAGDGIILNKEPWQYNEDERPRTRTAAAAYAASQAHDLHERAFGEKAQLDADKLSLAQQTLMATKARDAENALFRRYQINRQWRQNSAAAAAIERLSRIDFSNAKARQEIAKIAVDLPEAMGSKAFNQALSTWHSDFLDYKKAEYARSNESLTDPLISKAYNSVLESHGDPHLAALAANAVKAQKDQAIKLLASPHLSMEDKAPIYNPQTGEFNLDAKTLTNLSIKHEQAVAEAKIASEAPKNLTHIETAKKLLDSLGDQKADEPEWMTATRNNLQQSLRDTSWAARNPATRNGTTTAANSVTDAVTKYLGKGATPAAGGEAVKTPQAVTTPQASQKEIDEIVDKYTPTPASTATPTPAAPEAPDVVDRSAAPGPAAAPTADATPSPNATPTPAPEATPRPTPAQPPVPLTPKPKELDEE